MCNITMRKYVLYNILKRLVSVCLATIVYYKIRIFIFDDLITRLSFFWIFLEGIL